MLADSSALRPPLPRAPRIKNAKDVTARDFAKYNVVLFGDPGSNRWIARLRGSCRSVGPIMRHPGSQRLPVARVFSRPGLSQIRLTPDTV